MTRAIRCSIIRGGTSKGVYLKESDLPRDPEARDRTILGIFGSPDKRQINGLGGADPLTSKVCVVGPPPANRPDCHLTYTFGQVEIDEPYVDYHSLCGNLTAGVGAFALWENMVRPDGTVAEVRIYNTNLESLIIAEVPLTANGAPSEEGDYAVPGVPGTGAKITLNMADTAGGATDRLLPTGNPIDRLNIPGFGEIEASLVDIGNAHVFIRAKDVGMTGTETAATIDANTELTALLEKIRGAGAVAMGMIEDAAQSKALSPATPLIAMIAPPHEYENVLGRETVKADDVDFVSRLMFMQQMHKTYAGTSTVCTGVASKLVGTIVHEAARPEAMAREDIRIGHPAGVIDTEARVALIGNEYQVERATLGRTARRIMDGQVYLPNANALTDI
jgi:2-methylaconitate cis-trans-isomerase PrpF